MEPKQFIDIFTKKDFRKEITQELKKEFEQYPYFSPLVIAYLLSLRLNDDQSFRNELMKYSHYISNKRKFIELLFEIEIIKEKLKDKLSPEEAERFEKEVYSRAKQKHEQILHEIIEPKIEKLRKLTEITKSNGSETGTQKKQDQNVTLNVTTTEASETEKKERSVPELNVTQEKTTEIEKEQTSEKNKNQGGEQEETTAQKNEEKPTEQITSNPKDKGQAPEETKVPEQIVKHAESPTEQTQIDNKPTEPETKKGETEAVTIDDIFKKIEELKKKKLAAKDEFKQKVTTIDQLLDEHKTREEVIPDTKLKNKHEHESRQEPHTTQGKELSEKEAEAKQSNIDKLQQEKTIEKEQTQIDNEANKKTSEPDKENKLQQEKTIEKEQTQIDNEANKKTSEPDKENKLQQEKTIEKEQTQTDNEANKKTSEPDKKIIETYEFDEEEMIELDLDKKTDTKVGQTQLPDETETKTTQTPERQTHQQSETKADTEHKQEQVKIKQAKEQTKTEKVPDQTQQQTKSNQTTALQKETEKEETAPKAKNLTVSNEKEQKTAADRILEEIRRRRQTKQQQEELIDKFLQKQPKIDRTSQPSTQEDLSAPSTKEPDLVTERMARIYEIQELYDKAIETYKKLILKFPEKSDYFAQKIADLKNKLK